MANHLQVVWRGTVIHALSLDQLEVLNDALLGLDSKGKIVFLRAVNAGEDPQDLKDVKLLVQHDFVDDAQFRRLNPPSFIVPGFVDTHTHAPQYVFTGTAMDLPLLDWLNKYTFPTESKFRDEAYARKVYSKVIRRYLACGTTTAAYYGTIHAGGTKVLAELAHQHGQRAFIGKVSMDRNSPDHYREGSAMEAIKDAEDFVVDILSIGSPLVQPIITPRFVPTCTLELMKG